MVNDSGARTLGSLLLVLGAFAGCGHPSDDTAAVDQYLLSLPTWPNPTPDSDTASGASTTSFVTGSDNKQYQCTSTPHTMTKTPDQLVTLDPTVDVLWPGALLQGKGLLAGSLTPLPLTQRAPLALSIPDFLSTSNSVTVQSPNEASVVQAIGQLIDTAASSGLQPGSSLTYTHADAKSASEAALKLDISLKFLTFNLGAALNLDTMSSANLHTVVGYFVQKMFTATVPPPEQPGDFFSGLTKDELDQAVQSGEIGPDNLPVYVASVTYGRIMMFSITSSESVDEIKAALNAQFAVGVTGTVSTQYQSLIQNSSTTFKVLTVGGLASDGIAVIKSGDPSVYFNSTAPLTSAVPIAYSLRSLRDGQLATVSETTDYTVQSCMESAQTPGANFFVTNGDGTVSAFGSQGAAYPLAHPISGMSGASGIAYDSLDDRLYVVAQTGWLGGWAVSAFGAADGSPVSLPSASWGSLSNPTSISYDPKYDRLYITDAGSNQIDSYTPAGVPQSTLSVPGAVSSAFDPANLRLYVSVPAGAFSATDSIQAYNLDGSQVTFGSGAFAKLSGPNQIAYDEHHDVLYVTSSLADAVNVYRPDGSMALAIPQPGTTAGLVYDDVDDELAVLDTQASVLGLYTPDGSPVMTANGSFSPLVRPVAVAYRP